MGEDSRSLSNMQLSATTPDFTKKTQAIILGRDGTYRFTQVWVPYSGGDQSILLNKLRPFGNGWEGAEQLYKCATFAGPALVFLSKSCSDCVIQCDVERGVLLIRSIETILVFASM